MQAALDAEWPYVAELFDADVDAGGSSRTASRVDPRRCAPAFDERVAPVRRARRRSSVPDDALAAAAAAARACTPRRMGHLLAEMQHLAPLAPGSAW